MNFSQSLNVIYRVHRVRRPICMQFKHIFNDKETAVMGQTRSSFSVYKYGRTI